MIEYYRTDFE
jgi:hypothetical protein